MYYYPNAGSINAALDRRPTLRAVTRRVLEGLAPMGGKKEESLKKATQTLRVFDYAL